MRTSRIGWLVATGVVAVLVAVGVATSVTGGETSDARDVGATTPAHSSENDGTASLPEGVRTSGQMGQYALRQLGDVDVKQFNDRREVLIVGPDVPDEAARYDGAKLADGYTVRTEKTAFGRGVSMDRATTAIAGSDARQELGGPQLVFGKTDDFTEIEVRTDRVKQLDRERVEAIEAEFEKVAGGPVELVEREYHPVLAPHRG